MRKGAVVMYVSPPSTRSIQRNCVSSPLWTCNARRRAVLFGSGFSWWRLPIEKGIES